jgi:hypothetical protein
MRVRVRQRPPGCWRSGRVRAAADGRPVNDFEEVIERGLDRLPPVGLRVGPGGLDPDSAVDLLLDRQAEAAWVVDAGCLRVVTQPLSRIRR